VAERRPSVFVGSSSEGLPVAEAIQVNLDRACEVAIWSQGVFGLSDGTLETLVEKAHDFDFAILVLTPDDMTHSRNKTQQTPRDNVLLELGLFIGILGQKRTFVTYDRTTDLKLPSDLAGVTHAGFQAHSNGNLTASVGAACTQIKLAITELGIREKQRITFEIDPNTQFQIICDLLDRSAHQFIILMHEQTIALRREPLFGSGIAYDYVIARREGGSGNFSVDGFCKKLPDSGLLQQDLRNNVTLTARGHQFAMWLLERGHKADYFKTDLGGWGKEADFPGFNQWRNREIPKTP
jgi:Predicted nucleotide-binding protein containing TIR-like domain